MRVFLYVILFAILSPGMFFHIAAPKGKSIQFKSVIIHAFLFALAAYVLNILVNHYPTLDGFSGSESKPTAAAPAKNSPITIKQALANAKKAAEEAAAKAAKDVAIKAKDVVTKAKEAVGIPVVSKEYIPYRVGSLPAPMLRELPMKKSIQNTASHGRVGSYHN